MTSGEPTSDCDVVVLGLGPGGEYAARKLAEAGLRVTGVDEALVGGECPFWGCTPSKLMVRPADLLAEVHRADRLAGDASVRPDWSLVAARIREANHDWTDSQHTEPLEEAGVRIVRGHGRLAGPGVVRVEGEGGSPSCARPAGCCSTRAPSRCGCRSRGWPPRPTGPTAK